MSHISVNYVLLGGQFFLLVTVLFLQCLEGILSENSTTPGSRAITTANTITTVTTTTTTTVTSPFAQQPDENVTDNNLTITEALNRTEQYEYNPPSPVVLCRFLPEEFIYCRDPVDHDGNHTALLELGHGCVKIGNQGQVYNVSHTKVLCTALDGIECAGAREFLRGEEPCIKTQRKSPHRWLRDRVHKVPLEGSLVQD
ncbi:TM2 domain-containing protein 2 isoform X2 [Neoarius graeffei]|uniref:TM2 domain-containing protein 2 isoform X2 n=1 Tax=Neoarius graeffei TaxID=443677 RepID=UPI00298BF063|nr:TM2 domain-containing protein 2 isoform X2 [Neoarius graeffei]